MASSVAKSSPKDAQVMSAILKDMGVTEHEPRVINQMLEFTYRYVTDILDEAKVFSNHANKKVIEADDVRLAVQCHLDHSFTNPPPRDLLLEVARQKNNTPLPLIKPYTGPKLPPDRYCLSAPNYKLRSIKKTRYQGGSSLVQTGSTPHRINIAGPGGVTLVARGSSQPAVSLRAAASSTSPVIRLASGNMQSTSSDTMSLKRKLVDDEDYDKN